jgi:hypothetical protein
MLSQFAVGRDLLLNNPAETFLLILQQDFRVLKFGYRLKTAKIVS